MTENTQTEEVKKETQEIPPTSIPQESEADRNWRVVREKMEASEKARKESEDRERKKDEQISLMQEALSRASQSSNKPTTQQEIDLKSDDIPTGEEIKKYLSSYLPNAFSGYLQQHQEAERKRAQEEEAKKLPDRLRAQHGDFESVLTKENLAYLDHHHPEISAPFAHMPESVEKWSNIYKVVKKLVPDSRKDAARVDQNLNRPQSSSTAGSSYSSETGSTTRLSKEQKEANYKRLVELSRGG